MQPLKIFIGYDDREKIAFHVLVHSILKRSSIPISIIPLKRSNLSGILKRERGPLDSTDFAISRFLVPFLSDYEGISIFMDCDMLCLTDIADLNGKSELPISVCKHDYVPKTMTKMDKQLQTRYPRKNWSSLMVFNNKRCKALTPEYVNIAPGLDLHRFLWLRNDEIDEIPIKYNWLVGEYGHIADPKILHYTLGGPWFEDYQNCDYADVWKNELKEIK